jgi:signal transduction histidine kinase
LRLNGLVHASQTANGTGELLPGPAATLARLRPEGIARATSIGTDAVIGANESSCVPDADLANFNANGAKSRLRVWGLFIAVYGLANWLLPQGSESLGVSLHALLWPGIALVGACLAVIYLPLARRYPWPVFYLQTAIGLVVLSICIHVGASDEMAVAARLLFVLILVPPHLVSQRAGTVATLGCIVAHLCVVAAEDGVSAATFVSGGALGPVVAFVLIAMMASAHAGYIGHASGQLRNLAKHLDESRRRLGHLVDLAKTLNESSDLEGLFQRVNGAVRREFRADWCATYRTDRNRSTFELTVASEPTSCRRGPMKLEHLPVLDRLVGEGVIFLGRSEIGTVSALLGIPRSVSTIVLAALSRGSEMQGFLALGYDGERPCFSDGDLAQIAAVTEHATIALHKARLLEEERELSALKSEFLSTMSHELRTPINIIIGYIDMLQDADTGSLNDVQSQLFRSIDVQARELNELIESVLRIGKVESGRDAPVLAAVDIPHLVATIRVSIENLPHRDSVSLRWIGIDRLMGSIETDAARVGLVVRNLVGNAFKFTDEGEVRICLDRDGDELVIEISDTGEGIPDQSLPRIFDMFRQAEGGTDPRAKGVGFGLYIVDQTVRRLRGTVRVTSEVGVGTTFEVRLPGFVSAELAESA